MFEDEVQKNLSKIVYGLRYAYKSSEAYMKMSVFLYILFPKRPKLFYEQLSFIQQAQERMRLTAMLRQTFFLPNLKSIYHKYSNDIDYVLSHIVSLYLPCIST